MTEVYGRSQKSNHRIGHKFNRLQLIFLGNCRKLYYGSWPSGQNENFDYQFNGHKDVAEKRDFQFCPLGQCQQ